MQASLQTPALFYSICVKCPSSSIRNSRGTLRRIEISCKRMEAPGSENVFGDLKLRKWSWFGSDGKLPEFAERSASMGSWDLNTGAIVRALQVACRTLPCIFHCQIGFYFCFFFKPFNAAETYIHWFYNEVTDSHLLQQMMPFMTMSHLPFSLHVVDQSYLMVRLGSLRTYFSFSSFFLASSGSFSGIGDVKRRIAGGSDIFYHCVCFCPHVAQTLASNGAFPSWAPQNVGALYWQLHEIMSYKCTTHTANSFFESRSHYQSSSSSSSLCPSILNEGKMKDCNWSTNMRQKNSMDHECHQFIYKCSNPFLPETFQYTFSLHKIAGSAAFKADLNKSFQDLELKCHVRWN